MQFCCLKQNSRFYTQRHFNLRVFCAPCPLPTRNSREKKGGHGIQNWHADSKISASRACAFFYTGSGAPASPPPLEASPMGIQGLLPVLKPIVSEDHIKMFKGKTVKTLAAPRPQERSRSLEAAHSLRPLARRWPWMRRAGCTRARLPARTSWAWGFQDFIAVTL